MNAALKTKLITLSIVVGFACAAHANLINITNDLGSPAVAVADYDKGAIGNLGAATVLNWLSNEITSYNNFLNSGADLLAPVTGVEFSGTGAIDLTGYSYAVIHYGTGPGGAGQGGGVVALFLNGMTGLFTFPQSGSGPNGFGGISFVRLYGPAPTVPEAASTAALLGVAMAGIVLARRKLCA